MLQGVAAEGSACAGHLPGAAPVFGGLHSHHGHDHFRGAGGT